MARVYKRVWDKGSADQKRRTSSGRIKGASWQVFWKGSDGKEASKSGFRTRDEAASYGQKQEDLAARGVDNRRSKRIRVSELATRYLTYMQSRAEREGVVQRYVINVKGHLNNYICRNIFPRAPRSPKPPNFGGSLSELVLSEVTAERAIRFRDDLAATKLDHGTIRGIITTVHGMWEYARERGDVAVNPFDKMKVEKPRHARSEKVIPPSPAQVRVLASASSGDLRTMVQFTACTGLRSGEIRALRQHNIDLEVGVVNVTHSIDTDYDDTERYPKTKAAIRSIPLSGFAVDLMARYRDRQKGWRNTDLVFSNSDGSHLVNRFFIDALDELEGSYDLPSPDIPGRIGVDRLKWHGLRHFAISSWIYAGLHPKAVQTFAGHADIRTTMDRYGHLFPADDHRDRMNVAAALFA